jgi:hypothetical protein
MSKVRIPSASAVAAIGVSVIALAACGKSDNSATPGNPLQAAMSNAMSKATPDPCTLLTAQEAEAYVGVLVVPPFRGNDDGAANRAGDRCVYRGKAGQQFTIDYEGEGEGGAEAARVVSGVPNMVGGLLEKAGQGNLAATTHRVIADGPQGPWDKTNWIPGGSLFVTKGEQVVIIDVSGGSGKEDDAVAIARQAVARFDHPLDYDGAKAAANMPKPKEHPSSACDVLPQADVEAAIGALADKPETDSGGSKCTYHVASKEGSRTYVVEYVWQGGLKNYNLLKNGMSTLGSVMGGSIPTAGLDFKPDANTSKLIGGLMNLAGGGQPHAPGAATEVGFKTDTTLKGPWDAAMLMHGTQLMAVKNDVMVGMDLQSAVYDKATALLSAICTKI